MFVKVLETDTCMKPQGRKRIFGTSEKIGDASSWIHTFSDLATASSASGRGKPHQASRHGTLGCLRHLT